MKQTDHSFMSKPIPNKSSDSDIEKKDDSTISGNTESSNIYLKINQKQLVTRRKCQEST